jgi:putative redox protein
VELEAERAAEEPKVFTHVKLIYRLKGKNLKPAAVERDIKLSEEKYCSATAMFSHTAKIEHEWTVEED